LASITFSISVFVSEAFVMTAIVTESL
jgi:hypothetical protein